jgi:hypothetical protein
MADLKIARVFRVNVEGPDGAPEGKSTLSIVRADSTRGKAMLRMWLDRQDDPRFDDYGCNWLHLLPDQIADLRDKAALAGLTVEEEAPHV